MVPAMSLAVLAALSCALVVSVGTKGKMRSTSIKQASVGERQSPELVSILSCDARTVASSRP
jgi:hypothetical protein